MEASGRDLHVRGHRGGGGGHATGRAHVSGSGRGLVGSSRAHVRVGGRAGQELLIQRRGKRYVDAEEWCKRRVEEMGIAWS